MIKIGDIVDVKITGVQPYGAFALLPDSTTGLIHISEISDGFVKNVENYIQKGDRLTVKVIDIDYATCQSKLSLKALNTRLKRKDRRYSFKYSKDAVKETPKGFSPLKKMLNIWIEEEMKNRGK